MQEASAPGHSCFLAQWVIHARPTPGTDTGMSTRYILYPAAVCMVCCFVAAISGVFATAVVVFSASCCCFCCCHCSFVGSGIGLFLLALLLVSLSLSLSLFLLPSLLLLAMLSWLFLLPL